MKYLNLLRGEAVKYMAELRRYFFNTISMLIVFYIIFLAMFFGLRSFAGPSFDPANLDSVIAGYIMWMVAMMGFQTVSYMLAEETQRGTLEQFYLCALGMEWALICRIFLESLFTMVTTFCILYITMLTTGRWLHVNIPAIVGVLFLSLPAMWGLGLVLGSLTLVFKKIAMLMQVVTFGLIAVVAVNAYPLNGFSFLPFAAGATTINAMMTRAASFPWSWYLTVAVISYSYLFIGMVVFKLIERMARRRNLLGQY